MRTETDAQLVPKEQMQCTKNKEKDWDCSSWGESLISTKMNPYTQLGQSLPSKRNPLTEDEE